MKAMTVLTVAEMRELLGTEADGKTDAEIEEIRDGGYRLAQVIVNAYNASRRSSEEIALEKAPPA